MSCIPPRHVLQFGEYTISMRYREALWKEYSFYTTEDVVGTFLGHTPNFPFESEWEDYLEKKKVSGEKNKVIEKKNKAVKKRRKRKRRREQTAVSHDEEDCSSGHFL